MSDFVVKSESKGEEAVEAVEVYFEIEEKC